MARPQKNRIVGYHPDISYFKPRGIPMRELEEVPLTVDEREAIRLADLLGLPHQTAGEKMGVSRATFGRIIQRARNQVADALINGKAIHVGGGNYRIVDYPRRFVCTHCAYEWEAPRGIGRPSHCPMCKDKRVHRSVNTKEHPNSDEP